MLWYYYVVHMQNGRGIYLKRIITSSPNKDKSKKKIVYATINLITVFVIRHVNVNVFEWNTPFNYVTHAAAYCSKFTRSSQLLEHLRVQFFLSFSFNCLLFFLHYFSTTCTFSTTMQLQRLLLLFFLQFRLKRNLSTYFTYSMIQCMCMCIFMCCFQMKLIKFYRLKLIEWKDEKISLFFFIPFRLCICK